MFTIKRSSGVPAALLLLPALAVTACEPDPPPEMVEEIEELRAEREQLEGQIQELQGRIAVLQDLRGALEGVELSEEIRREVEEATSERDSLMLMVRGVEQDLDQARSQRQAAQNRAWVHQQRADSLDEALDAAAEEHETRLAERDQQVTELESELTALTAQRDDLEDEVARLEGDLASLHADYARAYYVTGTKEELRERGIVQEEGGARVILGLFWTRGETLVPSRDLDPADFTEIDIREVHEIALPREDVDYQVVSRQDLAYLDPTPGNDRMVDGDAATLRITDPLAFWQNSRYLILVERES